MLFKILVIQPVHFLNFCWLRSCFIWVAICNFSDQGGWKAPKLQKSKNRSDYKNPKENDVRLNGQNTSINKAVSKTVYKELRNRVITIPSAQEKYRNSFVNDTLDWPEIYSLPHHITSDTKTREFQFKLLNKYLATNAFLYKIGVVSSPVCSFCEKENESLEHIFIHCNYTKEFWAEVIKWLLSLNRLIL